MLAVNPDRSAWLNLVDHATSEPGMYSAWCGDICVYIGTSNNLRRRLQNHDKIPCFVRHRVDRVELMVTMKDHRIRLAMENFLIAKHKPILNFKVGRNSLGIYLIPVYEVKA